MCEIWPGGNERAGVSLWYPHLLHFLSERGQPSLTCGRRVGGMARGLGTHPSLSLRVEPGPLASLENVQVP